MNLRTVSVSWTQSFSIIFPVTVLALTMGCATARADGSVSRADGSQAAKTQQKFTVMSYNVQNFFDTVDSPDTNDEEFTPSGAQKWTEEVLKDKISNIGKVIESKNPDIITFAEVENQEVITRLMNEGLAGQGYTSAIAGPSDDARGIRNAVITRFPVKNFTSHKVWRDTWDDGHGGVQKTRDILEVTVVAGNKDGKEILVTILANHWPSRAGFNRPALRMDVAKSLTAITQGILKEDPDRLIISTGDYNDELKDKSMTEGLHLVKSADKLAGSEAGSFFAIDSVAEGWAPKDKGTFYYHPENKWNTLDHILMSGGASNFSYVDGSFTRVAPSAFSDPKIGAPLGCEIDPRGKYHEGRVGNHCPNGASDHFPLAADFELR